MSFTIAQYRHETANNCICFFSVTDVLEAKLLFFDPLYTFELASSVGLSVHQRSGLVCAEARVFNSIFN